MASLNQLKRTGSQPKKRVGRGGKRGKTSGRGTKGQNARSGRKKRPEMRDIIKKLPKRRGFGKNRGRTVVGSRPEAIAVPLSRLERLFDAGSEVTQTSLAERLSIRTRRKMPLFKIVGGGASTKKLSIKGIPISATARSTIEKAGGSVVSSLSSPARQPARQSLAAPSEALREGRSAGGKIKAKS